MKLCPRTVCIYKPGIPMPGLYCVYAYKGRMPCTGSLRCMTCGGEKK